MRNPNVPESLEGWWILHRMFRFDRLRWDGEREREQKKVVAQAMGAFSRLHASDDGDFGLAHLVGAGGELMLTHYARTYDGLAQAQVAVDKLELYDFLLPMASYVSVLEIGLYEATGKLHAELQERGLTLNSPEWIAAFDAAIAEQAQNHYIARRLHAKIPDRRYVCFYPMDKLRGEQTNWYMLPYDERARMMVEHGKIGRSYHGQVTQVISGSIGYDDYEWGVDLYADDPLVFKRLIYEMRFDEASAKYGKFGPFWSGLQFPIEKLPAFLEGDPL